MTLPLTSTGTGRGGSSVSGGDTVNVNEIMAPAAAITPLVASSCIACMARFVCPIRGAEMAKCDLHRHGQRHDGTVAYPLAYQSVAGVGVALRLLEPRGP